MTLTDYVREITGSGFPAIRVLPDRARQVQLDSYLSRLVEREFPEQGLRVRRPETLMGWMRAYAAATATAASYSAILAAATPGQSDKPAKTTTIAYRDVLARLWMLDPVPAYSPAGSSFSRLGRAPKHFLADPALAARLLGFDTPELARGPDFNSIGPSADTLLGRLFEGLVALSLQTYAQASGARLSHLRTPNGDHEVDFIVERGHAVAAFEVKLSPVVTDHDVKHLLWLKGRLGDRLTDAAVITTGDRAYRRGDGIAVIPAGLLGA